ncbi:MAG: hypothetical protein JNM52_08105 [Betaproteobacteria bacterium]|nr:hypothetical protein [Betaproteobacteria bacterium]
MSNKNRKSSQHITLVLIGVAAAGLLNGCTRDEVRRDIYASKQDCLADWGNDPKDCEPAYDRPTGNATTTHYYGRPYSYHPDYPTSSPSRTGKTIGSTTVSRGGFGSSGHSSSG